jgi:hypothetical protein
MKMGFGLVGLLVCVGIIAYWMSFNHPADTVRQGEAIKRQARQLAGKDEEGGRAMDTITLEEHLKNGKIDGILVQDIIANGAMENFYGLQLDDLIIAAGPMEFRGTTDGELAIALIHEAYMKQQTLAVIRNGQPITLPDASVLEDSGNADESASPLQRQLDAIKPGIGQ